MRSTTLNFLEIQILILLTEIYTLIYTKYKEGVDYYDDSKSIRKWKKPSGKTSKRV